MIGGAMHRILQTLITAPFISRIDNKKVGLLLHKPNHKDQMVWKNLIEGGHDRPIIDKSYSLEEGAETLAYFGRGKAIGKVMIIIKTEDETR